jgi:hypothetical protein
MIMTQNLNLYREREREREREERVDDYYKLQNNCSIRKIFKL